MTPITRQVNARIHREGEAKRQAVAHLIDKHGVSQRRACATMQVDRSTVRYNSNRPDDSKLRTEIKLVAKERRRFGYRRLQVMLERKGIFMNHKKLRRLYAEEKLQVRRRGGRKRALGTRKPIVLPDGPNQRPLSVIACNHLPVSGKPRFCQ